ncbi:mucin-binding lectin 1 [Coprinopsis sp. MPI-PUGE-AT-0042]|nr:mucin-binding lectin 1 [Coprinopsis sp. MPI-PUGE-AT-0042]KAH6911676.1 mucin-binding lectin 1 [Coprinopsis sp. MPI-PUGE-AT-0042]
MSNIFAANKQLTVVTRGTGSLSLLTWANTYDANAGAVGAVKTTNTGLTRWVVSFSHNYLHFALKWDGEGEAVYQVGDGLERKPVGRSWSSATTIHWSARSVVTEDVSVKATSVVNRDELTTIWIVPDTLL